MAPAEMVRAGCVVWVPGGGGQLEIVGEDSRLTYSSEDDGVEKIVAALADEAGEARLREALAARATRFSTAHFTAQVRRIVAEFQG